MAGVLDGRRGLIMGVANERSIAWGIARAAADQGADLGFTYVGDSLERRVRPLADKVDSDLVIPCDVQDDDQLEAMGRPCERNGGAWISLCMRWHLRIERSSREPFWTPRVRGSGWRWMCLRIPLWLPLGSWHGS